MDSAKSLKNGIWFTCDNSGAWSIGRSQRLPTILRCGFYYKMSGSPSPSCALQVHRFSHSLLALRKPPLKPAFSHWWPKKLFFVMFACEANVIKCNDKCDVPLQTPSVGFVKSSCIICKRSWPSLSLHTLKRSVTGSTCLFLLVHFFWNTVESFVIFFPTHKSCKNTKKY